MVQFYDSRYGYVLVTITTRVTSGSECNPAHEQGAGDEHEAARRARPVRPLRQQQQQHPDEEHGGGPEA